MNQNTNDTGGQLHNEAELCLSFFLLAFSSLMPLVCLLTSSSSFSSSSSCPHSLSSSPLHLSSSTFLLLSFCHFPLDTPSISPSLHLLSRLSLPSLRLHRNCWVIPLTGTAQLIGLNSFWQILSLSSCSPCFSKYGFVIIFGSSILTPYLPCPSSLFFSFFSLLLTTYLPPPPHLPKSFRPLAFLFICFSSVDGWWQVPSFLLCFHLQRSAFFSPGLTRHYFMGCLTPTGGASLCNSQKPCSLCSPSYRILHSEPAHFNVIFCVLLSEKCGKQRILLNLITHRSIFRFRAILPPRIFFQIRRGEKKCPKHMFRFLF